MAAAEPPSADPRRPAAARDGAAQTAHAALLPRVAREAPPSPFVFVYLAITIFTVFICFVVFLSYFSVFSVLAYVFSAFSVSRNASRRVPWPHGRFLSSSALLTT